MLYPFSPSRRGPRAADQDPAEADFAVVADALQRLLTRWPPHVTKRHFPAATKAHQALRIQLRLAAPVRLPAYLLSDVSHEIAEHVDVAVRQAAVRCMRRCAAAAGGFQ